MPTPVLAGGPTGVNIISPTQSNFAVNANITFEWTADAQLQSDQCFEVVFWKPSQAWNEGKGIRGASTETRIEVTPGNLGYSGEYRWAVLLVNCPPNYKPVDILSPVETIVLEGGTSSPNSGKTPIPKTGDNSGGKQP